MYQDGQTATNPQTGEKVVLRGGQWVPAGQSAPSPQPRQQAPAFVPGIKQVDPMETERLRLSQNADARASQDQQRQQQSFETTQGNTVFGQASKLRDDYNQDATVKGFLRALPAYTASLRAADGSPAGDLALTYGFATIMDPNSAVREGEQGMVANSDTLYGKTVAWLKNQLGRDGTFSPELRQDLLRQMRSRASEQRHVYDSIRRTYEERATRAGLNPRDVVGEDPAGINAEQELEFWAKRGDAGAAALLAKRRGQQATGDGGGGERQIAFNGETRPVTGYRFSPDQEAQIIQAVRDGDVGQASALMERFSGLPADRATMQAAVNAARRDPRADIMINYAPTDEAAEAADERERFGNYLPQAIKERQGQSVDAAVRGAADIPTLGFADEIAAAGDTLFGGGTYQDNHQKQQAIDEADRRVNGGPRFAGQVVGAVMTPYARGITTPGGAAITGALTSAGYAFGSGNSMGERTTNALLAAPAGAALGAGATAGLNALAPRLAAAVNGPARVANREARANEMATARNAAAAAETEGVRVSRGILDPRVRNQVTALETTQGGNPAIRQGLDATRQDIAAGVERLGLGGNARDAASAGEVVQNAGARFISKSRDVANGLYARAERLGGSQPVSPTKALEQIDAEIADLRALPEANAPLISYLQELRRDISPRPPVKTGVLDAAGKEITRPAQGLNIQTLRNLRSQMRGQINTRNLTATDAERRVKGVLDAASGDIAAALADNPGAAQAYARADRFFREKQQYITDVVQRFIGRRDHPISAEQAFGRFQSMAKPSGDAKRLGEMMRSLDPEERADMAATFAEALGRNNAGEFTAAQLVSQAEKLSDRAKLTVFGAAGKRSLDNLVTVARELRRTEGNLNRSRTGVAANYSGGYRGWLASAIGLVGGGGIGLLENGIAGGAVGATIGAAAVKGASGAIKNLSDSLSAKALMSPDIAKWIASAPRTTAPQAINAHIAKLRDIAARNPLLANDVAAIEAKIIEGIRQLPQPAAASGPGANDPVSQRREQPPQR